MILDPPSNDVGSAWERYKAKPWSVRILIPAAVIAIVIGLWADATSDAKESSPVDVIALDHATSEQ